MEPKIFDAVKRRTMCSLCNRETTNRTYLVCRKCEGVVVCLVCLERRQESPTHSMAHPYSIVQRLDFSVRSKDWTAVQELLLLEAVEKFGYGNWVDITAYIGSKTGLEVEEHFSRHYPLRQLRPSHSLERSPRGSDAKLVRPSLLCTRSLDDHRHPDRTSNGQLAGNRKKKPENSPVDERRSPKPSADPTLCNLHFDSRQSSPVRAKQFMILFERRVQPLLPIIKSHPSPADLDGFEAHAAKTKNLLGYMENRNEFDVEYNNEAELYLADMEFRGDESPDELQTKMGVLEIYQARILQREAMKRFVIEHRLHDFDGLQAVEKGGSNEERVFRNILKPQLQFMTRDDCDELMDCFAKKVQFEKLRQQIGFPRRKEELCPRLFSGDKNLGKVVEQARLASKQPAVRKNGAPANSRGESGQSLNNIYEAEVELCRQEAIDMEEFLVVKEFLIKRAAFEGYLQVKRCWERPVFDKRVLRVCQEFLVKRGLIDSLDLESD